MRILIDCLGSDLGFEEIIKGPFSFKREKFYSCFLRERRRNRKIFEKW